MWGANTGMAGYEESRKNSFCKFLEARVAKKGMAAVLGVAKQGKKDRRKDSHQILHHRHPWWPSRGHRTAGAADAGWEAVHRGAA